MATAVVDFSKQASGVVVIGEAAPAPGPAGMADVPTTATASTSFWIEIVWALGSVGIVVLAALGADRIAEDAAFPPSALPPPVEGLTLFAVFFVAAQAIERLLEPFASVLLPKAKAKAAAAEATSRAKKSVSTAAATLQPSDSHVARRDVQKCAQKEAELGALERHRTILFWVLATVVATAVSAGMKLYFLQKVGIANSSRWWEVLATGLIIGAGTKPLHDIIEFISFKKEASASAATSTS